MSKTNLKSRLSTILLNIPGWHTRQKIVTFVSDDWGSIRYNPYKGALKFIESKYRLSSNSFIMDTLESNEDISMLGQTLNKHRDDYGRFPVFTLNNIVANPDFEKIKDHNFREYFYEPFCETYKRYPNSDRCYELLNEGIKSNIFYPQFHGREHINVKRWMNALRGNFRETKLLFDRESLGLPISITTEQRNDFQPSFDLDEDSDITEKQTILKDGLRLFGQIWGYESKSLIAPNYFWNNEIETLAKEHGVEYIQSQRAQFIPNYQGGYNHRYRFTGQSNNLNQFYLVRNCYFEPSLFPQRDNISHCLSEIMTAFRLRKPAIISSHRLNYVGSNKESNRENGIVSLDMLLRNILKTWPEIRFMNIVELGNLIAVKP